MNSYPIYLLQLGKRWRVVFPKDKEDIGHCDFWEESVSHLVADFFQVPQKPVAYDELKQQLQEWEKPLT